VPKFIAYMFGQQILEYWRNDVTHSHTMSQLGTKRHT
jgi:hypothetical protein